MAKFESNFKYPQKGVFKAVDALRAAEKNLKFQCEHPSIGEDCRRACLIGGMQVIGDVLNAYKPRNTPPGISGKMGIIVSPMEDCPKGFEEIFVKTAKNRKVKICRLGPDVRRRYAPPGQPARKGATKGGLRRKRKFHRGVVTRDIKKYD